MQHDDQLRIRFCYVLNPTVIAMFPNFELNRTHYIEVETVAHPFRIKSSTHSNSVVSTRADRWRVMRSHGIPGNNYP